MQPPENIAPKYLHRKPAACPNCGHRPVAEIQYGLAVFSEELGRDLDSGQIILGGCCVSGDDPSWECTACGWRGWTTDRF
jgi:hypothetical protein